MDLKVFEKLDLHVSVLFASMHRWGDKHGYNMSKT